MTNNLIERVAKAIDEARMKWVDEKHPDGKYWDETFAEVPDEVLARAAIEAMERKYSLSEIGRMRNAVRLLNLPQPGMPYNMSELDARIETQLQTYMLNGTDPDELQKYVPTIYVQGCTVEPCNSGGE